MKQNRVAIVAGARVPFAKSFTKYSGIKLEELMTASLKHLVQKMNLQGKKVDDVSVGAVIMNSSDWNLARECVLGSGLAAETPAYDIRRACGTSLESVISVANKIALGQAEVGIAGGMDSNSDTPVQFSRDFAKKLFQLNFSRSNQDKIKSLMQFRPNDLKPQFPAVTEPRTGLSMGQHCEKMAKEWEIARQDQDQLSLESHQKAAAAYADGFYDDLVYEFNGVKRDTLVRGDTNIEQLAKLKPAFDKKSGKGTLTAGNSTALTDGSACVLLASEDYAKKQGWPILAYFVDGQAAGVDFVGGKGLLMAPTVAVGKLLQRRGLTFSDIDFFEVHEAFAAQALCTYKAWEDEKYCREEIGLAEALGPIDQSKLNIKGGSVALGHPFGATGSRIVAGLAKILDQAEGGRGLISVCTGGGMGVAAILEKE